MVQAFLWLIVEWGGRSAVWSRVWQVCAPQPGFRLRLSFSPRSAARSNMPTTFPTKNARVIPPMRVVSRKRTASQANLTRSEERAPKRHQPNNPRPLARPHHIKRFTPPPPKIKERPTFFSWVFTRAKDFWSCTSPLNSPLASLPSLTLSALAHHKQTSTCLCYLIQTERCRPAPLTRPFPAHFPTTSKYSRRPQKAPTLPQHPMEPLQQVPATARARTLHRRSLNMAFPNHRARQIRTATPAFNHQVLCCLVHIHITGPVELRPILTTRHPAKVGKLGGRSR